MAIALRAAQGSNNAGGATTLTATVPTGVQNGDILVLNATCRAAGAIGPADLSGWTTVDSAFDAGINIGTKTYWRIASSEPASYSVTWDGTTRKASCTMIALSGADTTALVSAQHSIQANASSSTVSAATLGSWASRNGIDLFFGTTATGTTAGVPTNYTQPTNGESASTGGSAGSRTTNGVAYRALSAVTTVGAISATYGAAAANIGSHVFIFEASSFTPTPDKWQGTVNQPIFESDKVVSY